MISKDLYFQNMNHQLLNSKFIYCAHPYLNFGIQIRQI